MSETALRVVIGGGGVSGLTTAYRLVKQGRTKDGRRVEVTLLEDRERLGGNIRTERHQGYVIDGGPDGWVISKPQASDLAKELGLGDRLIGTTAENRHVHVLDRGVLFPFPEGMLLTVPTQVLPFLRTRLLSPWGKARAGLDLVLPRRTSETDESIASFIRRRFGEEVLQKIAAPLLGGVFVGDVEALSIRATFPQLVSLEKNHRSLALGARHEMRSRASARKGGPPPSVFHSFPGGLIELLDALRNAIEKGGATIETGRRLVRVDKGDPNARFRVHTARNAEPQALDADVVVLAMPGYSAANALRDFDPKMADDLAEVPYMSSAVVALAYPRSAVSHPLNATGVITTNRGEHALKAVTFLSSKWRGRAPTGGALFRAFFGGKGGEKTLAQTDEALILLAEKELAKLAGTRGAPVFANVYRHERASAQPVIGHETRVLRIRAKEKVHPGLFVVGAAMDGVGIPDCVRQANDLAKRILSEQHEA